LAGVDGLRRPNARKRFPCGAKISSPSGIPARSAPIAAQRFAFCPLWGYFSFAFRLWRFETPATQGKMESLNLFLFLF